MSTRDMSISQRLRKASTPEAAAQIKATWAAETNAEVMQIFTRLERGIQLLDYDELCISAGQLKAVIRKHFDALPNVLSIPDPAPFTSNDDAKLPDIIVPATAKEPKRREPAPPIPEGYITAREWAIKNGRSPQRGQKLLTEQPTIVPAIKARNPHGGVDIWAVPKNTPWPF